MSTNIHISGVREVTVVKTGAVSTQTEKFDVWQTPTVITKQIMTASDKTQAYKDWVLSTTEDIEEPVYAEDDVFCEKEPIGTQVYNAGKEHVAQLDEWVQMITKEGYEVEFSAW